MKLTFVMAVGFLNTTHQVSILNGSYLLQILRNTSDFCMHDMFVVVFEKIKAF